jgi:hypothetical protein
VDDPTDTGTGPVATVITPDGTVLADGETHQETVDGKCTKYRNGGGTMASGPCPPQG